MLDIILGNLLNMLGGINPHNSSPEAASKACKIPALDPAKTISLRLAHPPPQVPPPVKFV